MPHHPRCASSASASQQIRALRQQFRTRHCSRAEFVLAAAQLYLSVNKPHRAAGMLSSIDHTELSESQVRELLILRKAASRAARSLEHTCSLNMIVRNEAETIEAALESIDEIMDEVVICDTGSIDDTLFRAQLYGIQVVRFPWQDDFSAARNAAIDATHGEWIFWMDADDRLEAPSARKLEELCRHPADGAFAFTVANERPGSPTTEFLQVRLFPRRNDLRFERCIHEQIMNATFRAGLPVTACGEIRIRHIGYQDPETHRRKAARNLPLILKELSRTPDDPSLLLSLGDCQWVLGRKTEATKTYRAIADNRECFETNRDVYVQAHVNVALLAYRRGDQHEAKQYLHRSLYLDEKRSEAWYHLGLLYRQEHREDRALDCLIRAATEKPPIRLTAVNNLSVKLNAIYTVADMLMARYCYHEAEKILLHATASYPQVCTFHAQLGMVRLAQDRLTEAAANFMDSINLDPANNPLAYRGMAEIYELLGDEKRAAQYSAASLQHVG